MSVMLSKIARTAARFAAWYRTPSGMLSLLFIAGAIALSAAQQTAWALVVLTGWLAFMLPHKLTRERRDWEDAVHALGNDGDQKVRAVSSELEAVNAEVRRMFADLSTIPTTEEIQSWQLSVESSQQRTNQSFRSDLDAVVESHTDLEALVTRIADDVEALSKQVTDGRDTVDWTISRLNTRMDKRILNEVQSVSALYSLLEPALPLPPLGGWALSAEASMVLARLTLRNQPELIVETGSGSSTVITALALAKNGRGRVVALEHDLGYATATRQMLRDRGLEKFATVVDAPLKDYRIGGTEYRWYDIPDGEIDEPIDVLLVDGPPGTTGPMARYPAVPVLLDRLSTLATVLVDDANRDDEVEMTSLWQSQFNLFRVDSTDDALLATLRFASEPNV